MTSRQRPFQLAVAFTGGRTPTVVDDAVALADGRRSGGPGGPCVRARGPSFADFDAAVYGVEEAWGEPDVRDPLAWAMTVLLFEWGEEPDAVKRAGFEDEMRRLMRTIT